MQGALRPSVPLTRTLSSRYIGWYEGRCPCSPIRFAIVILVLEMAPRGMTMSLLTTMKKDQFGDDAYWIVNSSMIIQSLVSLPAAALCGYFSQPHRLGRKATLFFLTSLSTAGVAVPTITTNAYTIVGIQTMMACFGSGSNPYAVMVVLTSWTTDWCKPDDKMTYFALLLGSMFVALSISPFVPGLIGTDRDERIYLLASLVKLASPLYVALIFPRTPQSSSVESMEASTVDTPVAGGGSWTCVCASLKYLFQEKGAATVIYMMVNFCDSAVADNIAVFLEKERGFTPSDLNILVSILGCAGFFAQCVLVPLLNLFAVAPQSTLVWAVMAMVLHFAVLAFASNKLLIFTAEPIGSLGYIAGIATQTIISGTSTEKNVQRDQGTLLGTLSGLKLLASCVGPLTLAFCTTSWRSFPSPLDWPGVGFSFLLLVIVVAWGFSIRLCGKQRERSC